MAAIGTSASSVWSSERDALYLGRRMTADGYLALPDDGVRYELIDGIVCMSPSPTFRHQETSVEIASQLHAWLRRNPIGRVAVEVDVKLADDLVLRPDLVVLLAEKAERCRERISEPPDLVVEIISPVSRTYDTHEKRRNCETAGVRECWLIDAQRDSFSVCVLSNGKYQETLAPPGSSTLASILLPGFSLDLQPIRKLALS